MDFDQSLRAIHSREFQTLFYREMQTFVRCLNIHQLTRCGGQARDPMMQELLDVHIDPDSVRAQIRLKFVDGAPLDCSGFCSGTTVERSEIIIVTIDRATGSARWQTVDGVIHSDS